MNEIDQTERTRERLQDTLNKLIRKIGRIQIGTRAQFPFGWRKAAKGRTVWRILEEAITQNLENNFQELGLSKMVSSDSEVSVYDCQLRIAGESRDVFLNVKSAVEGGRTNKDDISKAEGLQAFYTEDINRQLFIATFVIRFDDDMHIALTNCHVLPIAWLPDIYVNPSNNGNLQSSKYKDLDAATRRSNREFFTLLLEEMKVAAAKRLERRR